MSDLSITVSGPTATFASAGVADEFYSRGELVESGGGILLFHGGAACTLDTPGAPTATPTGGTGSSYSYRVVAQDSNGGHTAAGTAGTCSSAATLDADNYNTIEWDAVEGAHGYAIYRQAPGEGAHTLFVMVSAEETSYVDYGTGDATPYLDTHNPIVDARHLIRNRPPARWIPNMRRHQGELLVVPASSLALRCMYAIGDQYSASSEPTWSTTHGTKTTDRDLSWRVEYAGLPVAVPSGAGAQAEPLLMSAHTPGESTVTLSGVPTQGDGTYRALRDHTAELRTRLESGESWNMPCGVEYAVCLLDPADFASRWAEAAGNGVMSWCELTANGMRIQADPGSSIRVYAFYLPQLDSAVDLPDETWQLFKLVGTKRLRIRDLQMLWTPIVAVMQGDNGTTGCAIFGTHSSQRAEDIVIEDTVIFLPRLGQITGPDLLSKPGGNTNASWLTHRNLRMPQVAQGGDRNVCTYVDGQFRAWGGQYRALTTRSSNAFYTSAYSQGKWWYGCSIEGVRTAWDAHSSGDNPANRSDLFMIGNQVGAGGENPLLMIGGDTYPAHGLVAIGNAFRGASAPCKIENARDAIVALNILHNVDRGVAFVTTRATVELGNVFHSPLSTSSDPMTNAVRYTSAQAFARIGNLMHWDGDSHFQVLSRTASAPFGGEDTGSKYLVPPAGASGDFEGHEGELATWNGSAWEFSEPANGDVIWIISESIHSVREGDAWIDNTMTGARIAGSTLGVAVGNLSNNAPAGPHVAFVNSDYQVFAGNFVGMAVSANALAAGTGASTSADANHVNVIGNMAVSPGTAFVSNGGNQFWRSNYPDTLDDDPEPGGIARVILRYKPDGEDRILLNIQRI